jgi:hypothetical protein
MGQHAKCFLQSFIDGMGKLHRSTHPKSFRLGSGATPVALVNQACVAHPCRNDSAARCGARFSFDAL